MEINWLKFSPAENMTALVTTEVPDFRRAETGATIMRADPEVEQVGYLVEPRWPESSARLEMAGGEFCAGAVLCAAAHAVSERLRPGSAAMFPVECSAVPDFITTVVSAENSHFDVTVELPLPNRLDTAVLSYGGKSYQMPLIKFPGIACAILPAGTLEHAAAEEAIREWTRIEGAEAMALLLYDASALYIEPLVYVPAANTLCWERSCAGGTAAIGAFLSTMARSDLVTEVRQPGGTLTVRTDFRSGRLTRIAVRSRVELLGEHSLTL